MWELDYKESWAPTWCWGKLLRVPWTERRSNQSILKEIIPGCSLEGLMLKLKVQYFGHWCEELTHLRRPYCWERLKVGGEGEDRGWDGWMASPTQWTWVWANSGRWWRTGKPGVLQSVSWTRLSDWTAILPSLTGRTGSGHHTTVPSTSSPQHRPVAPSAEAMTLLAQWTCFPVWLLWGLSTTRCWMLGPWVGVGISTHMWPPPCPREQHWGTAKTPTLTHFQHLSEPLGNRPMRAAVHGFAKSWTQQRDWTTATTRN